MKVGSCLFVRGSHGSLTRTTVTCRLRSSLHTPSHSLPPKYHTSRGVGGGSDTLSSDNPSALRVSLHADPIHLFPAQGGVPYGCATCFIHNLPDKCVPFAHSQSIVTRGGSSAVQVLLLLVLIICAAGNLQDERADAASRSDMIAAGLWMSAGALELLAVIIGRVCVPAWRARQRRRRAAEPFALLTPAPPNVASDDVI